MVNQDSLRTTMKKRRYLVTIHRGQIKRPSAVEESDDASSEGENAEKLKEMKEKDELSDYIDENFDIDETDELWGI